MTVFPNARNTRVQALLGAAASWFFILWLIGLPFLVSRSYIYGGLILSTLLWACVIVVSLSLKCPNCAKSVALTSKMPGLGPDWPAMRKQFFPIEAVRGTPVSATCPHCGTQLQFSSGARGDV